MTHSGDTIREKDLLQYLTIEKGSLTKREICVFISGFELTPITQFRETNPALLIADHADKVCFRTVICLIIY